MLLFIECIIFPPAYYTNHFSSSLEMLDLHWQIIKAYFKNHDNEIDGLLKT